MDSENSFLIENELKNMVHLEQFVQKVVDCTSRFNNSNSIFYAPLNISGKYLKYPSYGDFPEAYCLRTYGKWWKMSEGTQIEYRPQDIDTFGAEEYLTVKFQTAVVPRDICVYEIYNPGAIIRIWGKLLNGSSVWVKLWEGKPQECPDKSRKFHPTIRKINQLITHVRLEFNQTNLKYHMSIDAVLLGGWGPTSSLQYNLILKGLVPDCKPVVGKDVKVVNVSQEFVSNQGDFFTNLPYEVIIHIFQYLDLKSLSKCLQVNKRWFVAANDPILYQNISLKKYWNFVNCNTLEYFSLKCSSLKKLDLSWCGSNIPNFDERVKQILEKNASTLTHLSLCNCVVTNGMIEVISNCSELTDLRLKNTTDWTLSSLNRLTKLISIDLTATNINDSGLITLLMSNVRLKHVVIDLCEHLNRLDNVCDTLVQYNPNLVTWSSWKTRSLTFEGAKCFGKCPNLTELDLGWCLIGTDPGDCLEKIAFGCRLLRRLIISEWRGVHDYLLQPVLLNCKELNQLDLLGIKNITSELCEQALVLLPKLRLLEISFCDLIRQDEVDIWRSQYPHITIQRSCQYVVNDYLN